MKDLTNHLSFDSVDQSVSCTNMEYLILTDRDFRSLILSTSRLKRKEEKKILKQILTNCFVKIGLKQTVKKERNKPAVIWLLCNRYARGKTGLYGFAYQQTLLARPVPVAWGMFWMIIVFLSFFYLSPNLYLSVYYSLEQCTPLHEFPFKDRLSLWSLSVRAVEGGCIPWTWKPKKKKQFGFVSESNFLFCFNFTGNTGLFLG